MFRNLRNELEELKLEQLVLERNRDPAEQQRLLDFYIKILPRLAAAERCSIFIKDPEDRQVWLKAGTGVTEREIMVPQTSSIAGRVIESGSPLRLDHLDQETGVHKQTDAATGFVTRQILCVPIHGIKKEQVIGAIELLNKEEGAFSAEDQELLAEAAHHIALFIDNIYLHQRIVTLSGKLYQAEKRALGTLLFALAAGGVALLLFFAAWAFIPMLLG